jgi:hypothetical protein
MDTGMLEYGLTPNRLLTIEQTGVRVGEKGRTYLPWTDSGIVEGLVDGPRRNVPEV